MFKASPTRSLIALIIFAAVAVGFLTLALHGGYNEDGVHFTAELDYIVTVVFSLFAVIAFFSFRQRLKPTNWLLRITQWGILVKYRSYQNWRMPADDVQVVGLDFSEIAWVRKVHERRNSPHSREAGKTETFTYLEMALANNTDASALDARLETERRRLWKFRILTYPVEVMPEGIVRVYWKVNFSGARPTIDEALRCLSPFIRVEQELIVKTELRPAAQLPLEDQEEELRQLARRDKIGAVKLARELYGCSFQEARDRVERLLDNDG